MRISEYILVVDISFKISLKLSVRLSISPFYLRIYSKLLFVGSFCFKFEQQLIAYTKQIFCSHVLTDHTMQ